METKVVEDIIVEELLKRGYKRTESCGDITLYEKGRITVGYSRGWHDIVAITKEPYENKDCAIPEKQESTAFPHDKSYVGKFTWP